MLSVNNNSTVKFYNAADGSIGVHCDTNLSNKDKCKLMLKFYNANGLTGVQLVRMEKCLCIYVGPSQKLLDFLVKKEDGSKIRLDGYRSNDGELKHFFDKEKLQKVRKTIPEDMSLEESIDYAAFAEEISMRNEASSMILRWCKRDDALYATYIGYVSDDFGFDLTYFNIYDINETNILFHPNVETLTYEVFNINTVEFHEMIKTLSSL